MLIDPNPFKFGVSLTRESLVDRETEVQVATQSLIHGARLFLIGPRRFGKTSILNVAKANATTRGVPTILVNAEATLTLNELAGAVVTEIASILPLNLKDRSRKVIEWFATLKPTLKYEPLTDSVTVGVTPLQEDRHTPTLVEALDRADALAQERGITIGIIIDEFQELSKREGIAAEKQLRARVQEHRHLAYIFAGSDTTMMSAMVTQHRRPFYRLGSTLWVDAIPAADMANFMLNTFKSRGITLATEASDLIFESSRHVPYNIQKLCAQIYSLATFESLDTVTPQLVSRGLETIIRAESLSYQTLFQTQPLSRQKVLRALADQSRRQPSPAVLARDLRLPPSTVRSALKSLIDLDMLRPDLHQKGYLFVDPFFAGWISTMFL